MTHIRLIGLVAALFHTIATTPYAAAKLGESHPPQENRGLIYNDPQPTKKVCTSLDVALPKTAGYHPDIDDQVKNVKTRIIGGTEVDGTNVYPFFVSWGGSCGGSLIHSDIVLTAAHCGEIVDPIVVINAYALDNAADSPNVVTNTEGTVVRTIESRSMHPLYDDTTVANDFLLLKLNKPVTGIDPIPINDVGSTPSTGEKLKVIGLGNTSEGGLSQPDFLREVIVSAVSDSSCDASYASYGGITKDVMFCAGATGKDSCQGDSGGPIFTLTETGDFASQVGVVSWGIGCADSNFPGVYAEISTAKDWIDSEICKLSNNKPSSCAGSEPVSDSDDNGGSKSSVDVIVRTDAYPEEISWTLMDNDGAVLSSVAKGTYSDENESFSTTVELIEGTQYTFEIKDSYGDGICCSSSSGNGYYAIKVGETLLATGGEYESSESTTFTVPRGEEDTGDNEPEDEPIDENNDQPCVDSLDQLLVDSLVGEKTCKWLAENLFRFDYLCRFVDVAVTCPVTCEFCQYVQRN